MVSWINIGQRYFLKRILGTDLLDYYRDIKKPSQFCLLDENPQPKMQEKSCFNNFYPFHLADQHALRACAHLMCNKLIGKSISGCVFNTHFRLWSTYFFIKFKENFRDWSLLAPRSLYMGPSHSRLHMDTISVRMENRKVCGTYRKTRDPRVTYLS